jgi:hypothetical protein
MTDDNFGTSEKSTNHGASRRRISDHPRHQAWRLFAGNLVVKPSTRFNFRAELLGNGLLNAVLLASFTLLAPTAPVPVMTALVFAGGMDPLDAVHRPHHHGLCRHPSAADSRGEYAIQHGVSAGARAGHCARRGRHHSAPGRVAGAAYQPRPVARGTVPPRFVVGTPTALAGMIDSSAWPATARRRLPAAACKAGRGRLTSGRGGDHARARQKII